MAVKLRRVNRWDVDYRAAVAIQERLRTRVIRTGGPGRVKRVAGADVSYAKGDDRFYAAVVVLSFPELEVIEEVAAFGAVDFPYIPGLLTFREGPILEQAFARLKTVPDLVLLDGQGVAHPRGLGLAAHMGLIVDVPSIGVAKTRLCGEYREPRNAAGSSTTMTYNGAIIGKVVRTRADVRPVFVSIGHRISLASAVAWTLKTCRGCRLPEPTRRAHILVNQLRIQSKEEKP